MIFQDHSYFLKATSRLLEVSANHSKRNYLNSKGLEPRIEPIRAGKTHELALFSKANWQHLSYTFHRDEWTIEPPTIMTDLVFLVNPMPIPDQNLNVDPSLRFLL